jgi:PAS domain S-box-containing protein
MSLISISGWLRRAVLIVVSAGLATTLMFWYFAIRTPPVPRRTLRIGFEHVPPVQIRTDGGPAGLAVETVNEAAKRAGVSLQWVETGTSSDEAFRRGLVDLWPIMADLPDRRKRVHITRPWLHTSHTLVLRRSSASPDRSFAGSIALFQMPLHVRLARQEFPEAQLVQLSDGRDIVKEVCRGTVSAGFLEDRAALAALREKPAECASIALRIETLPDLTLQLGIASTFEAAGAADKLRAEIGNLFRDGTLAATMARYSYYGLDDTWATYNLMEAAERARWVAWGLIALGVALAVTVWQAASLRQRKRSEAALRVSEERFRAIFRQAAVGVAQVTLAGEFTMVNDRLIEILGYTPAELRGKTFRDITHPDDLEESLTMVNQLAAGRLSSPSCEKRYLRKDGAIVWARMFVSRLRDAKNRPQSLICVLEDYTDRIQAEHALRDSERRLTLAQSAARLGVWNADLHTNITTFAGDYTSLYGLPNDHPPLPHEEWIALVHPADRDRVESWLRESIEQRRFFDNEFRVVWPDGSVHWLLGKGTVFLDDSGRPTRMAGVNFDITAHKQAEAALRESEARFTNMADAAPVMMWASGPAKGCTFFNKGWLAFTGRTMERELGTGWAEGVHPEDWNRCFAIYSSSFDARRGFQIEYRLRRADGEYRWVLDHGVPRFEPGGVFVGYIGSCVDITDLKRTQEEYLAKQKLESLGTLAGGIAHDFNNLLGGILASAELVLADRADGSPLDEEELLRIRTAAIRGGEIVRQLMIYAGEESQIFESVDISRLVGEMLQLLKVSISKRAILKVDLPENLPTVRANAAQIRQVVMNLITNASEALGGEEGIISVAMAHVRPDPDRFEDGSPNVLNNDHLRLTVSDTGCGMTEERQARIFDPFFTTKFTGRGLGLSAVRGVIRDHGGTINVVSAPGQGSRFEVLLPCASQPAPDTHDILVSDSAVEVENVGGTVLVVEDEDALRCAVSKMLRKQGFFVLEASDGRAGVDLFRANEREIDVVLLDLTLPGMNGREVLEELRRMRPGVNVIVTTAYSQDAALTALGAPQAWLFIRKPYRLREVTDLLRNVCLRTRSRGHTAG